MAGGNKGEDVTKPPEAEETHEALAPVVVRKTVARRAHYRDYRDDLREDFLFSCAYCTITETEAQAVGFHIDHYMPQEHYAHLVNDYTNLMWSCEGCNAAKGNYPKPGRVIGDRRVIKVDTENPRQHLALHAGDSDSLVHKTPTGEFNIQLLRLNRQALLRLRAARRKLSSSLEYIAHGLSELLNIGLDEVDSRHRTLLLRVQEGLGQDYERRITSVRKLIEAAAKSELLDADPNREKELEIRRKYLRSVGAIGPKLTEVPKTGPKGGRSRRRR